MRCCNSKCITAFNYFDIASAGNINTNIIAPNDGLAGYGLRITDVGASDYPELKDYVFPISASDFSAPNLTITLMVLLLLGDLQLRLIGKTVLVHFLPPMFLF